MPDVPRNFVTAARAIHLEISEHLGPPEEGLPADGHSLLPRTIFRNTRGYLERVLNQANGAYSRGWYDAAAVMVRRLVETLIIEVFEKHGIAAKIKNANGDFLFLKDLIDRTLNEGTWNLGRNTRSALPRLKDVGDKSAHSRRYNAVRSDLDALKDDLRVVAEELLVLAGMR